VSVREEVESDESFMILMSVVNQDGRAHSFRGCG